MTDIDFILQKTKALKEARGFTIEEAARDMSTLPVDISKVEIAFYDEATRFADALEVVVKHMERTVKRLAKLPYNPETYGAQRCLELAIAQAAGILKGEE